MSWERHGALLRRAREMCGLSQRALAELADVSQQHVSSIERGDIAPTLYTLDRWPDDVLATYYTMLAVEGLNKIS